MAELSTGWTVLWANDEAFGDEARVGPLSCRLGPVLAVRVNETCMHSTAALLEAGKRRWRLHHAGDRRIDFLEAEGTLPEVATSVEAKCRAMQAAEDAGAAEVDYLFEVPLGVAKAMCGFKHDEMLDPDAAVFTVAVPESAARTPFWSRLLRRR